MAGCKGCARNDENSIRYRWNPAVGAAFELTDYVHEEHTSTLSKHSETNLGNTEQKSSAILSTAELISAFEQIWDSASPLAVSRPKKSLDCSQGGYRNEHHLHNLFMKENDAELTAVDDKDFKIDPRTASRFSPMPQLRLELLGITQKLIACKPSESYTESLVWRILHGSIKSQEESLEIKEPQNSRVSYELGYMYRWMDEIVPRRMKSYPNIIESGNRTEFCNLTNTSNASGDRASSAKNSVTETVEYVSTLDRCKDLSSSIDKRAIFEARAAASLYTDYFLGHFQDNTEGNVSRNCRSGICADYHITCSSVSNDAYGECQHEVKIKPIEERMVPKDFVSENESRMDPCSLAPRQAQSIFAKQEHAVAGALAGISVSLCLHPVDTVKTIIQSRCAEQKSLNYIGRSIISERGFIGLYNGIASNIASSAPISAVYTFTYESVKGVLLPLFPKEYSSFAHCVAGGCASIATSFIFTPSERIKQQMQVGSRYRNCWDAFLGILGKGGLPSLYAGWGAVLCRNVPHSIIKFYVYENLKQLMSPSLQLSAQPSTLQTLLCGGLAGSTAALFTTPFDVVKTRLQTQIPGSLSHYNNVFHALKEIGRQEGLNGLYRGLIPRLVMYMSQGALFFASYESCKRLFSLEVASRSTPKIGYKEMIKDDFHKSDRHN